MTSRMELFRQHFPEPPEGTHSRYDSTQIDSEEVIDGEYLSGSFDWYFEETGYNPEDIGVSCEAIVKRAREKEKLSESNGAPALFEQNGVSTAVVAGVMNQLMKPLFESIGTLLKNNTEAMEQIASSQDVIRNRMEALEKQVRLQTPVTDRQARYLADAAREKARELLDKKAISDKKAITKLAGLIKKSVLSRHGISSLREVPRCEYNVAMSQIETWNSALTVLDIVREARARAEENHAE